MTMANIPNLLTLVRVLAVPFVVLLMYSPSPGVCLSAMLLFIAASLTDVADGVIARRMGVVTTTGKFLDPLADKLLISAVLIMLVKLGWVEAWLCIVIISRELAVTGLRAIAADCGMVMAADSLGKLKTIVQTVALCPLILHYVWFGLDPQPIGEMLLYIAVGLTVFSGAKYMYDFRGAWDRTAMAGQPGSRQPDTVRAAPLHNKGVVQ